MPDDQKQVARLKGGRYEATSVNSSSDGEWQIRKPGEIVRPSGTIGTGEQRAETMGPQDDGTSEGPGRYEGKGLNFD